MVKQDGYLVFPFHKYWHVYSYQRLNYLDVTLCTIFLFKRDLVIRIKWFGQSIAASSTLTVIVKNRANVVLP
jgi:hypothetical protein